MSEWQPIETAPKDGRKNLLLFQQSAETGEKLFVGRWGAEWGGWLSIPGAYAKRPTHWQPLPAPPQNTTRG